MDNLLFSQWPTVVIGQNSFVNIPIIVQYETTPMLEVVRRVDASYTTRLPIYHRDGTKLAVVEGTRLFLTKDGEKAGLQLRHPGLATICELEGIPLFEIEREQAATLKMRAEVFTFDGTFLKWSEESITGLLFNDPKRPLHIGGLTMHDVCIVGSTIGIQIWQSGAIAIGVS